MTEKEKCAQGLLYNANYDEELINDRNSCKSLCQQYNQTNYNDTENKTKIIQKIIVKSNNNCFIEQPFWCDYGYNIEIGENFYSNHNLVILDCAKVKFGNNVFIGPNCGF